MTTLIRSRTSPLLTTRCASHNLTPKPQSILQNNNGLSISPSLLHLPPSLRARAFHASTPHQSSIIEPLLLSTHSALQALHSTTLLPWGLTIPLFALFARTFLTLPLSISTRRSVIKQQELQPLMLSWTHAIRRETMTQNPTLGPIEAQRMVIRKIRQKRRELYRRWKCQVWRNWVPALAQLPIWLCVIETVRGMCGSGSGLLGMIFRLGGADSTNSTSEAASDLTISTTAMSESLSDDIITTTTSGTTDLITTLIPPEPTLATEGILWFTDLTSRDPHLILPFLLSGIMFLNLSPASRKTLNPTPSSSNSPNSTPVQTTISPFQRRLTRTLRLVALAVGPMTLNVPAGMLLYWISSSSLAYLQAVLLDRFMPVPSRAAIQPCKVPVRGPLGAATAVAVGAVRSANIGVGSSSAASPGGGGSSRGGIRRRLKR